MQCDCSTSTYPCHNQAIDKVWCPTWLNKDHTLPTCSDSQWATFIKRGTKEKSDREPLNVCAEHLAKFKEAEGEFYFGDEAQKQYVKANFIA